MSESSEAARTRHHPTIMIIEDDADISEAIVATLEDNGYSVLTATNGQDALDKLRRTTTLPNLILLDLMMPVMDGWQFRAAQTSDPLLAVVPVVLLSARVDVEAAAEQMATAGWLRKPVDLAALLDAVARPCS